MRQLSFVFWAIISIVSVVGSYQLNAATGYATEHSSGQVLAATIEKTQLVAAQKRNPALDSIAQDRATDMVKRRYYAHMSPDGTYFFDHFSSHDIATTTPSCENLLLMPSGMAREEVDAQWHNSPNHDACLRADHDSYGYVETVFDSELNLSVYVYIAASL